MTIKRKTKKLTEEIIANREVNFTTKEIIKDYLNLFKPGIVALVLISSLTGLYIGSHSPMTSSLIYLTLVGIGLATAGSAALNNYYDRDIDALMDRTSKRALPKGSIHPTVALISGLFLATIGPAIHYFYLNPVTGMLTFSAVIGYVVLYGMIMKRRTSWANQVGGIAGALPPVIGYTAATGVFDINALVLFLIVVLWQQPHALSLALKYREDYMKANIPVVPAVRGVKNTKIRILLYTLVLYPMSIMPYYIGLTGKMYLFACSIVSLIYIGLSIHFIYNKKPYSMFHFFYSIIFLIILFTFMVIDLN